MTTHSITERFAPLTRSVSELLNHATPAAYKLWGLLRQEQRPGVPFNFSLKEAAEKLGYSARWLRSALEELVGLELVQQLEQWWGQRYQLVIYNPGQQVVQKNGDLGQKTSKIQASNPHSAVPINRDLEEIRHGVEMDKGDGWYTPAVMESDSPKPMMEASPPAQTMDVSNADLLFREVTQVAPGFNPKVFADALARFGETRIRHAIAAISEQIDRGNAFNPAGLLLAAIRRGFTANQLKRGRGQVEGKGGESAIAGRVEDESKAWYLPGTTEVFVAPQEERSRLEQEAQLREAEFRRSVGMRAAESEDLSQVLVEISIALRESGLSRERVRELLEERYGVRSQSQLQDDQLKNWLDYLRLQPKQYHQTAP